WHTDDFRRIERDHGVEAARRDEPHGRRAEAQRQQAVERGGAAAALQVTEDEAARLLARHRLDAARHFIGDPAQTATVRVDEALAAAHRYRTLRHDHHAEVPPFRFALADLV